MFEEIAGLPLHPLAVHAAVVFVPLFALVSVLYALVPRLRGHLALAAVALAVLAPITAAVAVLSGDQFQQRRQLPLEGTLADHRDFGLTTLFATAALAVVTLALVWVRHRSGGSQAMRWTTIALTVLVVIAAAGSLTYAILAGDSGTRMVWEPLWPSG